MKSLESLIRSAFERGELVNQSDLAKVLESQGFRVNRQNGVYLTVKREGERSLRLYVEDVLNKITAK